MKKLFVISAFLLMVSAPAMAEDVVLSETPALETLGPNCEIEETCGELAYVDCDSEVDGPAYYVEEETLRIIMRCGGACMIPSNEVKPGYCSECPPQQWKDCKGNDGLNYE
jgi:hypothetical protein